MEENGGKANVLSKKEKPAKKKKFGVRGFTSSVYHKPCCFQTGHLNIFVITIRLRKYWIHRTLMGLHKPLRYPEVASSDHTTLEKIIGHPPLCLSTTILEAKPSTY